MHSKILVIDDDAAVRAVICKSLNRAGYETISVEDGLVAYEKMPEIHTTLRLVITDMRMPRMNGADLVYRLRTEYPGLKVLCISAYSDPLPPNGHCFLSKPFKPASLVAIVKEVLRTTEGSLPQDG